MRAREKLKAAGKAIIEMSRSGKAKYLLNPVPFLGDFGYISSLNKDDGILSEREKKIINYGVSLALGSLRSFGLLATAMGRSGIEWYLSPSLVEEISMVVEDAL